MNNKAKLFREVNKVTQNKANNGKHVIFTIDAALVDDDSLLKSLLLIV